MARMNVEEGAGSVPSRYRGVWRRTLLETPDRCDTSTTVFWLQTARWHSDIRIPAGRPGFGEVATLGACTPRQLEWLAGQQGFAGLTQVDVDDHQEKCTWHRIVDYQPPGTGPDTGIMRFEPDVLVETGVHAPYLEHWQLLPDSQEGFAVLRLHSATAASPAQFLMVAGGYVMYVRNRNIAWLGNACDLRSLPRATRCALLDFEISFGRRTGAGWTITHSTLPWQENRTIGLHLTPLGPGLVEIHSGGSRTTWEVLEWTPPRSQNAARAAQRA